MPRDAYMHWSCSFEPRIVYGKCLGSAKPRGRRFRCVIITPYHDRPCILAPISTLGFEATTSLLQLSRMSPIAPEQQPHPSPTR